MSEIKTDKELQNIFAEESTLSQIKTLYCENRSERNRKAQDKLSVLFEMQKMIQNLNLEWRINRDGVVAQIYLEKLKNWVKLYASEEEVFQIPMTWLLDDALLEQEEYKIFFSILPKENGMFLDIGANVGWYSILASMWGAEVYAFEPVPATYQRLLNNLKLNGCRTVQPIPVGLGENKSKETFYYHDNISGASSRANLDYFSDGNAIPLECDMDTLDHFLTSVSIDHIDLIKCDVEGGELFVFQGAKETIQKYRPYVMCEMLRKWSGKFDYHPDDIIALFHAFDYVCIALKKDAPGTGYVINQVLETTQETNFLFVPEEKLSSLKEFFTLMEEEKC